MKQFLIKFTQKALLTWGLNIILFVGLLQFFPEHGNLVMPISFSTIIVLLLIFKVEYKKFKNSEKEI